MMISQLVTNVQIASWPIDWVSVFDENLNEILQIILSLPIILQRSNSNADGKYVRKELMVTDIEVLKCYEPQEEEG